MNFLICSKIKQSLQICCGTRGKLQYLKLDGNAAIKITSTSLMIHSGFRVFNVNRLVGTFRKGIQI